jgi:SPW repeat-containing protein
MQNGDLVSDKEETNMKNEGPNKGLEWTNLILGICLAFAAFMFAAIPASEWNAGIVGTLIACCSAIALYCYGDWAEWSNLTLGSWAGVPPFLLGFGSAPTAIWTHAVIGLSVATIAIV